jgi:hypothetical protein
VSAPRKLQVMIFGAPESALSRFATKAMFHVADVLPPLQRMFRSER